MKCKAHSAKRGSVMMEYVVLNVLIGVPLVLLWNKCLFDGKEWVRYYFETRHDRPVNVAWGAALQDSYRELFHCIMVPFP